MRDRKILLAEDDRNFGMLLKSYLDAKNYETTLVTTGIQAFDIFSESKFNICIFDIIMPEMDGINLAKAIRSLDSKIPIVFLTAKNLQEDIIEGFISGADDYITKPFSMDELLYRIEAILRRTNAAKALVNQSTYTLGSFTLNPLKQILSNSDKNIKLTTKESELLTLLYQHRNETLERRYILKTVWFSDNYFNARSMDVYISKLRKHLSVDPSVKILNVHGRGYKLIC